MFKIESDYLPPREGRYIVKYTRSRKSARRKVREIRREIRIVERKSYHIGNVADTPVWDALCNGYECFNHIDVKTRFDVIDAFLTLVRCADAWREYINYDINSEGGWFPEFVQYRDDDNGGKLTVCVLGATQNPTGFNVINLFKFPDEQTAAKFGKTFLHEWNELLTAVEL